MATAVLDYVVDNSDIQKTIKNLGRLKDETDATAKEAKKINDAFKMATAQQNQYTKSVSKTAKEIRQMAEDIDDVNNIISGGSGGDGGGILSNFAGSQAAAQSTAELNAFQKELSAAQTRSQKLSIELEELESSFNSAEHDMDAFNDEQDRLQRELDQSRRLVNDLGGVVENKLSESFRSGAIQAGKMAVGIFGVTEAVQLAQQAMDHWYDINVKSEAQGIQLDYVFNKLGSSIGMTREQADAFARSMAINTLTSVEEVGDAMLILQSYFSITDENFTKTIELAQDMSAVFGGSLTSNVNMLAKALESPTTNLGALTRNGITFNETEKETIKNLTEANRLFDAQALILEKVNAQVGGQGGLAAGGLAGGADTLNHSWDELFSALELHWYIRFNFYMS